MTYVRLRTESGLLIFSIWFYIIKSCWDGHGNVGHVAWELKEAGRPLVSLRGFVGTRRWARPGKTYFGIQTLNVCHGFFLLTPKTFLWWLLSAREAFELSVGFRFFFLKLFFIDTLFPPVFFIAAHMLCSLCTSQQELLLLFLTVWSIFMLLVPCSDLFLILTNIHFQTHLLKRSLCSAKDTVRHGGKEASDPHHPGTAHCQPTWAVFTKDTNS